MLGQDGWQPPPRRKVLFVHCAHPTGEQLAQFEEQAVKGEERKRLAREEQNKLCKLRSPHGSAQFDTPLTHSHTHTLTHSHTHTHTHTHRLVHTHTDSYTRTHAHTHRLVHTHTRTHAHTSFAGEAGKAWIALALEASWKIDASSVGPAWRGGAVVDGVLAGLTCKAGGTGAREGVGSGDGAGRAILTGRECAHIHKTITLCASEARQTLAGVCSNERNACGVVGTGLGSAKVDWSLTTVAGESGRALAGAGDETSASVEARVDH